MSDTVATFLSTIFGAIVGGLIAYIGQIKVISDAKEARNSENRRRTESLAQSLLFKTIRIYSNNKQIHEYIEKCFSRIDPTKNEEPWQVFLPLANPPEYVYFLPEEMSLFLENKDFNLFNLIASMDVAHNSLSAGVAAANVERRHLTEKLHSDAFAGAMASGTLSPTELAVIRPRMIEVNSLLMGLREMAARNAEESESVLTAYQKFLADKLKMKVGLQSKTPS